MTLCAAVLVTVMTVMTAQAPAAGGDVQTQVESLYAEGAALYKAGKYRPAIEKFEQAFALFPEPNLLYNMGRAYEALGEIDQAMLKYRLCAQHPQAAADVAAKAREKLTVLEAAKATSASAPAHAAPGATPSPSATPGEATAATATPASNGFPILGTVTAAVGLAAAGAGGVVYALGAGSHGQIETAKGALDGNGVASLTRVEAQQLAEAGTTQKTVGVVLLSVGGALAAASIPIFLLDMGE